MKTLRMEHDAVSSNLPTPAGERATTCMEYGGALVPRALNGKPVVDLDYIEKPSDAWTSAGCEDALRTQYNGLICGESRHWGIFRAKDAVLLSGNDYHIAYDLKKWRDCVEAIRDYSTPSKVCVGNGVVVSAVDIASGSIRESFDGEGRWTRCARYIGR